MPGIRLIPKALRMGMRNDHRHCSTSVRVEDVSMLTGPNQEMVERLRMLQTQEHLSYPVILDYLKKITIVHPGDDNLPLIAKPVDEVCRDKMTAWSVHLANACQFQLGTVMTAVQYVDRFLAQTTYVAMNRDLFQLASMTCMYLAAKIYEPRSLSSAQIASVSKGKFTVCDLEEMETQILFALDWKLHPPHGVDFCRLAVGALWPHPEDEQEQSAVYAAAEMQLELSMYDYGLSVMYPASLLTYCALSNALQVVLGDDQTGKRRHMQESLDHCFLQGNRMQYTQAELTHVQRQLYQLSWAYEEQEGIGLHQCSFGASSILPGLSRNSTCPTKEEDMSPRSSMYDGFYH